MALNDLTKSFLEGLSLGTVFFTTAPYYLSYRITLSEIERTRENPTRENVSEIVEKKR